VRPLARSVHGEVAQRDRRQPEVLRVQPDQVLGGELADAVRRDRLRDAGLAHRKIVGVAVDRRGRRVDELAQRAAAAGLEQALRRVDVVVAVDPEVFAPARAHARLGGLVEDPVDAADQRAEVGIDEALLDEAKAGVLREARKVSLLELARVVIEEAVDPDDVMPAGHELLGERRTDEPGDTGNQCLHETLSGNDIRSESSAAKRRILRAMTSAVKPPGPRLPADPGGEQVFRTPQVLSCTRGLHWTNSRYLR